MNLRPLIDDIASQAEAILADAPDRAAAAPALAAFIALEYPRLPAADRMRIAREVWMLWENDGRFPEAFVDSFESDFSAHEDAD